VTAVDYSLHGDVAVLSVTYKPVNALSHAVRSGLQEGIDRALGDPSVKAMVIIGAGKTFPAGADIAELGTAKSLMAPRLKDIQAALDSSPKPVVAAIHGTALGGGLELALTCHGRVAVESAMIGLPEVKLGLLPGAGGTVRLPRLAGPKIALDLITSGDPMPAPRAHALGIIDAIVADLLPDAVTTARNLAEDGPTGHGRPTPIPARTDKIAGVEPSFFEEYRKAIAKRSRGQIAPLKIVDCVEAACFKPFAEALEFERGAFAELMAGDQRKALIHCFFAEREAQKIPGIPAETAPLPVERVAVIGSGLMGGGIAMVFANAGIAVRLLDIDAETVARGMAAIEKNYAASVSRGSITQEKVDRALSLIAPTLDYGALGDIDLAIEAAPENMALKQQIFAKLDAVAPPHAILGSNTSSLDIDQIAAATARPEKVIGVHFFSPANVMKLLETVRGARTSPETIATVMALGKRVGKVPVLAGNCDGFIGNRMLQYYSGAAEFMLEQGATPEQIDRVAESFGMAMGPMAMRDMAGLAMAVQVRQVRRATLPPGERLSPIIERLVEAGRVGQKTGKGFYRYEGRIRLPDQEALAIIESVSRELGITRRALTDEEVRDRLFHPLVNEGAKELEQGIAIRAGDIDVAWVNGYGFPAHRGGPMFWGELTGLDRVVATARQLGAENGMRWTPSPLLEALAQGGLGWRSVVGGKIKTAP
jgi:3-hydroxyacyl-CoA dehydrogenase